MISSSHLPTDDSKTLLSAGVSEIARRLFSVVLGGLDFGTAIMFVCLHLIGTIPSVIDVLKMQHNGSHNASAKSRRNQFGNLSGPGALRMFICYSLRNISSVLIEYSLDDATVILS